MWDEQLPDGRYKFFERFKDPYTGTWKRVATILTSNSSRAQKHTKISSEEISDGRKYSLLFLYDKVEVSC